MSGVRLDALLLSCLDTIAGTHEKASMVWNAGGRDVMAEKLKEIGISSKPMTMVDIARGCGILGPDPNEVVIENAAKKRRARRV